MSGTVDCWNITGVRGDATCERLAAAGHCRNCPEYVAAGRMLLDRDVPEGAPEQWARAIAEPQQVRRPGTLSVVVFRIAAEWLALKTVLFERAVGVRPVHGVPSRTNRIFRGLVNVDGELLLCFSAGAALGLEVDGAEVPGRKGRERLLVVSCNGQRFAFTVDEVLGVCSPASEDFAPVPATLSNAPDAVTVSVFSMGPQRTGLLDETRFFQHLADSLTT